MLSRILKHIESNKHWAIISSDSCLRSNEKNNQYLKRLKTVVNGYIELKGAYYNRSQEKWVKERSLFIPNITKDKALRLSKSMEQESFIFGDCENICLLFTDSEKGMILAPNSKSGFRPRLISEDGFSMVNGKSFCFSTKDKKELEKCPNL